MKRMRGSAAWLVLATMVVPAAAWFITRDLLRWPHQTCVNCMMVATAIGMWVAAARSG